MNKIKLNKSWLFVFLVALFVCFVAILFLSKSSTLPDYTNASESNADSPIYQVESYSGLLDSDSPADLPAPAKKLTSLLEDTKNTSSENNELEQQISQMDQRIIELNKELKTKGFDITLSAPSTESQNDTTVNAELEQRLQAIKEHYKNRNETSSE